MTALAVAAIVRRMAKRSDRKEDIAERRAFAIALRKTGMSYEKIGHALGEQFRNQKKPDGGEFTAQYASKLVREAIKDIYREKADDLVAIESARLDDMTQEVIAVLRTKHVMVSNGSVVKQLVLDANGAPIFNPTTGLPMAEPILDDGPVLAAIDRLIKIQERRAKLFGLDKPTKVASTDPDGKKSNAPVVIMATPEDAKL